MRAPNAHLVGLAALLCCGMYGCGGTEGPRNDPGVQPEPAVVRIGTFLTPSRRTDQGVNALVELLTAEPLVAVGWDGRPVYRLAESSRPFAKGHGVVLKLRPRLQFHDGTPAEARRIRDILAQAIADSRWLGKENVAGVTASGDEIAVTYKGADSFGLTDLHMYPIKGASPAVRSGPFRIGSRQGSVVLHAFEDYHQGRPTIDRVEIRTYPTHRAAWTAMMRNEVNALHEVSREAVQFADPAAHIRMYPLLRPYYIPLGFNLKHPVLGRREVRLALNQAVDREEVVRIGMRGQGQPADGPIWPYHWAYTRLQGAPSHNPDAARLRLDAAGLPLVEPSMARDMAKRFRFRCLVLEGDSRFDRIALVVQRQLLYVGVDMEIVPVSAQELTGRLASGDFDAFLFEMTTGRALSWVYRFWHSPLPGAPPSLDSGYHAADAALDRLRAARTDDEVRRATVEVQEVLRRDPPALFLAWPQEARAVADSFSVTHEPMRDVFYTLWRWQPTGDVPQDAP